MTLLHGLGHGVVQALLVDGLDDVVDDAHRQAFVDLLRVGMGGEHDDLGVAKVLVGA